MSCHLAGRPVRVRDWRRRVVLAAALSLLACSPALATIFLEGNFIELPIDDVSQVGRFMATSDAQGVKYNALGTGGSFGQDFWVFGTPVYNYTIAAAGSTFRTNGQVWAVPPTVVDTSVGSLNSAVIAGDPVAGLHFVRVVSFDDGDQVIAITDTLTNTGGSPLTNVATLDNTDPDQDFPNFNTANDVVSAAVPNDLVVATGPGNGLSVGFGSPDPARVVDVSGFSNTNPYTVISFPSDPNGAINDIGINLAIAYGTLGVGQSKTVAWRIAFGPSKNAAIANYVGSLGVCGNGIVEFGEACDEGPNNGTAAACCTTTCTGVCDDGNQCTDDTCDSTGPAFVCGHTGNTAPCTPADRCTVGATCSGGVCGGGSPKVCDDHNACTDDICNHSTGGCFVVNNAAPCSDGNPCTDNDQCRFGTCQAGTFNANPCNDGNACTQNDHCQFGFCQGGGPVDCNDHNECTTEFCQPFFGCVRTLLDGIKCQDNNPCTTDDACRTGVCTGDPRNCFDEDPCTVDTCNSAGGAFLCLHEDCTFVSGSSCPAQCQAIFCGNNRIDPGETCDPPDATPQPGRPGQVTCRLDCTSCGDAITQAGDGETCDDGNLTTGCNPLHPTQPLDACQTSCTPPICQDPARIRYANGMGILDVHGRIEPVAPAVTLDPVPQTFVVELTSADGLVLFRSSLEAGALVARGRGFKYVNRDAKVSGGIGRLKFAPRGTSYRVTLTAYGNLTAATDLMTTHLFIGAQEWTLRGQWVPTKSGWQLDARNALGAP